MADSAPSCIRSCYSDLRVSSSSHKLSQTLQTAADYGYGRVAVDCEVNIEGKKRSIPAPVDLSSLLNNEAPPKGVEVLHRVTVCVEEVSMLHAVQSSPSFDAYDIVALRTGNESVFQQACSSLNIDLISLDLSTRLPFYVRPAQVSRAISRGLLFEICYSPAIKDSSARRHTIANAKDIVSMTKGKGIVVSSDALKLLDLRGPMDVINLGHLFGLSTEQSKSSITTQSRAVLVHSRMRRKTVKGVIECVPLSPSDRTDCSRSKRSRNSDSELSVGGGGGGREKKKKLY